MKFKNNPRLILICIVIVLCPLAKTIYPQSLVAPRPNYVDLDHFYSEEINRFNREFLIYLAQLDDCLDEMSWFEHGRILLEPVLCKRFQQIRPQITGLMDEVEIAINDYRKALQEALSTGLSGDVYDTTQIAVSRAMSLRRIYKIKLQLAELQSKRVQQHERDVLGRLERLEPGFNSLPQSKELKPPAKNARK